MTFRILSLNAWGGRVHGPLMAFLAAVDADVLCLQEVVRTPGATSDWLTYRGHGPDLPQRANLFDEIAIILPCHHRWFMPCERGDLFDGGTAIRSEFGIATFVRGDHAVIGQAAGFVHGEFEPDGWGGHPRARGGHAVRIADYTARRTLTVAHMHGLRDEAGKADTPARAAQAERFAGIIESVRRRGEPLVACGDFNVLPGSTTLATLGRLGLTDLVTTRGFTDTRTSYYAKDGRFADYMMVSSDVEVVAFDAPAEPEVSDHRALLLDIG